MYPKTFVFDFDSTLVNVESLDELARIALHGHPQKQELVSSLEAVTQKGMSGELTFDASLRERLKLFSASRDDVAELAELLQARISPSVLENQEWFMRNAASIYVVSGGFYECIRPVTDLLRIPRSNVFANRFEYTPNGKICGFSADSPLCKPMGKVEQLSLLRLPRPLVMVGDGYTDLETRLHGQADEFWAYTETITRPKAVAKADRVLSDFNELLTNLS